MADCSPSAKTADRAATSYDWRYLFRGGRQDGEGVYRVGSGEWDYLQGGPLAHDPGAYWGEYLQIKAESLSTYDRAIVAVLGNRYVMGSLQSAGGLFEIGLGVVATANAETIIGPAVGIPLILHGADTLQAGLRTLRGEDNVQTFTQQGISYASEKWFGATQGTAEAIGTWGDAAVGVGLSLGAGLSLRVGAATARQAATRARVMANIAESQAARRASNFGGVGSAKLSIAHNSMPVRPATPALVSDQYGVLSANRTIAGQAHHLNQAAAYGEVIPFRKGIAVKLEGDILVDVGAPHTRAHLWMEDNFWSLYRGAEVPPTNLQYTRALQQSLRVAGLPESQVQQAVRAAVRERVMYGELGGKYVPRIPYEIENLAR